VFGSCFGTLAIILVLDLFGLNRVYSSTLLLACSGNTWWQIFRFFARHVLRWLKLIVCNHGNFALSVLALVHSLTFYVPPTPPPPSPCRREASGESQQQGAAPGQKDRRWPEETQTRLPPDVGTRRHRLHLRLGLTLQTSLAVLTSFAVLTSLVVLTSFVRRLDVVLTSLAVLTSFVLRSDVVRRSDGVRRSDVVRRSDGVRRSDVVRWDGLGRNDCRARAFKLLPPPN